MRYPDASQMRYPDASKAWDPRAKPSRGNAAVAQVFAPAAAAQSGQLPPPANAAAASGNSPLNIPQASMVVGEPIPVVFGRRRGVVGGVLIFPKATEARFENNATTVTSRYHMVLGEGRMPDIQRRDVRLGECRIGTFSQNYNQRAGTFTPGNFAITATGYTVPTFPTYTGGGGNYQGLSTFEAGATVTGGSDDWRTGWNIFIRGGMIIERGRLLDATVDSSDNLADLTLWALQRSGRVPAAMIDLTSLASAALFLETVGLWCNGEFNASGNLGDWLIRILPDFLLRETKVGGKFGLRPLLPVSSDGTINTSAITPEWLLTEAAIVPDSYQIEYAEAASRRPVAMAMLWRQQADDTDVPIVRTLTVGDQNASGPVEQHDLSQYATTENHAAKVGAYLYARRTLSTHTATVRIKPGNQTGTIAQGDIVQIYLAVETSREAVGRINRFYQVESIGHSLSGEETLSLSHFPVNSSGQGLIALAVANATAPGATLSSNRTGGSCDITGASTSTTVPSKSTSGTPISGQATGGGSSSTYWAATGQFIDLFGGGAFGGAAPIDSPAGPAEGGARQFANSGGPIGPSTGTNVLGGDARCPYGYAPFVPENFVYFRAVPNVISNSPPYYGWFSTATHYFVSLASSFLSPRPVVWPGSKVQYGVASASGMLVQYGVAPRSIPLNQLTGLDILGGTDSGTTNEFGYFTGRDIYYEFSNSNTTNTPLARWSGNYGKDNLFILGYVCSSQNGTPGTPVLAKLYKVVEGDSMAVISQKIYGTTARANDIKAANAWLMGIDNWGLVPGTILTIPD
jgi:hypothetical protein